ncbi:MAG: glycosyltransferase family 2 protein [Planctomycetes bacterium]|nr:glycosyltransferase family 2 protein [Planctomycetota bacterium]
MLLSVVVPCYNEAGNVAELHRQLDQVAARLDDQMEFILVDDGSRDHTLDLLKQVAQRDPRVRVLSLSRNFGHQAALTAGIEHAAGDAVVVMDADLQHPPELILDFVRKWREGHDLVYAYRQGVKPRLGYRLINAIMKINVPAESADFRLMDRKLVDAFRRMPERARFIRGMIAWLGFRQAGIGYADRQRFAGRRSYTLRQTARMALNAILAFSSLPLRLAAVLGVATLGVGLLYAAYILYAWVAGETVQGWTALILTMLVLGGVQLLCLGIIAEYIGRIFEEVKHRPLYVVREWIGPKRGTAAGAGEDVGRLAATAGAANEG